MGLWIFYAIIIIDVLVILWFIRKNFKIAIVLLVLGVAAWFFLPSIIKDPPQINIHLETNSKVQGTDTTVTLEGNSEDAPVEGSEVTDESSDKTKKKK